MKVTTVLAAIYFVQDYVHIYMISLHKQKYFKNGLGLCSYILFLYTNKKALKNNTQLTNKVLQCLFFHNIQFNNLPLI